MATQDQIDDLYERQEALPPELQGKSDDGHIGFIILIVVLMFSATALLFGCLLYRSRFIACSTNQAVPCPPVYCADGSDPLLEAQEQLNAFLVPIGGEVLNLPP